MTAPQPPAKKPDPYADLNRAYAEEISGERVTNLAKQVKSGQDDPGDERRQQ